MKLENIKNWEVVHFEDYDVFKDDEKYFPEYTWNRFLHNVEVEEMEEKGHYKVIYDD